MRDQGHGHIVNISSIAGVAPMAGSGVYAAAKSAIGGLSESLAAEVAPLGLKVTVVAPGGFRTDFLSDHSIRRSERIDSVYAQTADAVEDYLDNIAGQQIGDPTRGARAIIAAVDAPQPPRLLVLGSDALKRSREKQQWVTDDLEAWADTSISTDFDPAE